MRRDSKRTYDVGYGKPPVATRFRKGASGNPSGRPKKCAQSPDPGSILEAIDNEEIIVTVNGRRRRMTKAEIGFRQLFAKATAGDLVAARLIVEMAKTYFVLKTPEPPGTELVTETEAAQRFGRDWAERVKELNARFGEVK